MTPPDGVTRFAAELSVPRDADGPVYAEPWQAEAFALTVQLHATGCFTWPEWAATLAAVLREVRDRGEPDDGSQYYDHWLVALERLVIAKRLLDAATIDRRKAAWAAAYLATPHGQPVMLSPSAAG
ncbi:MAG: nitrile hydratase accessory protein [Acetobacteraceae bacterium]